MGRVPLLGIAIPAQIRLDGTNYPYIILCDYYTNPVNGDWCLNVQLPYHYLGNRYAVPYPVLGTKPCVRDSNTGEKKVMGTMEIGIFRNSVFISILYIYDPRDSHAYYKCSPRVTHRRGPTATTITAKTFKSKCIAYYCRQKKKKIQILKTCKMSLMNKTVLLAYKFIVYRQMYQCTTVPISRDGSVFMGGGTEGAAARPPKFQVHQLISFISLPYLFYFFCFNFKINIFYLLASPIQKNI